MKDKDSKLIFEAYKGAIPEGAPGTATIDILDVSDYFDDVHYMSPEEFEEAYGQSYEEIDYDMLAASKNGVYTFELADDEPNIFTGEWVYMGTHIDGPNPRFSTLDDISDTEIRKYFTFASSTVARAALRGLR